MKLLLDTHIALWAATDSARLGDKAAALIREPSHIIHVSAASIWEIAIKHALQRGSANDMPVSGTEVLRDFEAAGYELLPVTPAHAAAVDSLPRQHGDPFDRLLAAQAITEPMHLLTRDARLAAYSPLVMLV